MPQHVLMTTDVVGGVWDFALLLGSQLRAQDATRVTLLALGQPSTYQAQQATRADLRLIAEQVKLEWMRDCHPDVLRTRERVSRLARELRPDVVHANQFAAACADVDVPVVLTLHSDVLSWRRWTLGERTAPPEWSAYTALVQEAMQRAHKVVAVSAFLARETRTLYGIGREIDVVHNGWPSATAPDQPERASTTLVAGRVWDAAKNIALVAEAAQGWQPGGVYLAGEQRNPDSGDVVSVPAPFLALGFLDQVQLEARFRSARVYLSAARYDPFGLLPLQAALHGCCLLLSDIPSYRELWDGAAAFFDSDDAADLRRQWSQLIYQPAFASKLAERARQRAMERYSVVHMATAYRELYASLMPSHGAVAA
jgi:glycosyltransferase involved in cell wall biosynthesis